MQVLFILLAKKSETSIILCGIKNWNRKMEPGNDFSVGYPDAWHSILSIDEFQINEINVDLRTSGFDNEVLCVDACAVWWERESFYCLPRISVVTWHREPRFQCGSARTCSIWNSSILNFFFLTLTP